MTEGLYAYASTLNSGESKSKNIEITIKKAENGYIFELQGMKELPKQKDPMFDRWESFQTIFVYQDLQIGLNEVDGFFKEIENVLTKKVKRAIGVVKKKERSKKKNDSH